MISTNSPMQKEIVLHSEMIKSKKFAELRNDLLGYLFELCDMDIITHLDSVNKRFKQAIRSKEIFHYFIEERKNLKKIALRKKYDRYSFTLYFSKLINSVQIKYTFDKAEYLPN